MNVTIGKHCNSYHIGFEWEFNLTCNGQPYYQSDLYAYHAYVFLWRIWSTDVVMKPTQTSLVRISMKRSNEPILNFYYQVDIHHKCNRYDPKNTKEYVCTIWPGDSCYSCSSAQPSKCGFNIDLSKSSVSSGLCTHTRYTPQS
uniref:SCP domain-containing protein n=1 Tax=Parastrongyloides trichosuri TaxID=131310 RepID=A0A0N4ZZM0_PARTI